jgi:hypothetical protein
MSTAQLEGRSSNARIAQWREGRRLMAIISLKQSALP